MNRVRVALIGTGGIAGSHLRAFGQLEDRIELVAAADVDADRVEDFCARHGIPASYTDVDAMLCAEQPDLVDICTPPASHAELSVQALQAGAWVLCEKPLCGSLQEMDRIEQAEAATGRYCSSVVQWRFGSGAQHLKRLLGEGAMGAPLVAVCLTAWYRDQAYYDVPWRGRWETELGGATMGHGIHAIDLLLWLYGDWRRVQATIGTLDRDIEVEDVSMALVDFDNGAKGSIVSSVLSPRQESYLRLDLQRATVELKHLYGYQNQDWSYAIAEGSGHDELLAGWREIDQELPSSHAAQITALLDAMERHERPPTSGPEARRTVEFVTSLYKAAATGQAVTRGAILPGDPFYTSMSGRTPSSV